MASEDCLGIGLVALAALTNIGNLTLKRVLAELHLPYYRMAGAVCLVATLAFVLSWLRSPAVRGLGRREAAWVGLRGLFGGAGTFAFSLLAVEAGAPLGDIGALNSVNVVIAAALGQVFLGESATWLHGLGIVLAVTGALLISQPSFLFGRSGEHWSGYLLAGASAVCMALNFLFGRMARGAPTQLLTASAFFLRGVALCLLVPVGAVDDFRLGALWESPAESAAWFVVLALGLLISMSSSSAGGKRCPVAVSSVVYTAVNMATGYLAQTLLFGRPPHVLTVLGSLSMVAAVAATAAANRRVNKAAKPVRVQAEEAPSGGDVSHACDCIAGCCSGKQLPAEGAATIFRHFYADDATPEGLAARTLELTRSATVIKLTPDPYFMTLSFGGRAAPRVHNDARPALVVPPVSPEAGAWQDFRLRDRTHIDRVLATVRVLKSSAEAAQKPLYVNVFAPFTVAMQCDARLIERLADDSERPAVARGLARIAQATAEYISALAAAGADGIFYANKCMRLELGELVEQWVVPLDAAALAPLRRRCCARDSGGQKAGAAGWDLEEGGAGDRGAPALDVALHCCGTHIDYTRILAALGDCCVYPRNTALSWNFEEGNPTLEHVLETTGVRVWGTYPRALLRKAADGESGAELESFLLQHRQWLEAAGHLHRVVVGPDCCPGAFVGEEVPAAGWHAAHRAYEWLPGATVVGAGAVGGA
jgi:drug/metabolite transporter (DMT)-like permease